MRDRANEIVAQLALLPHPEGGFFREIWRSTLAVQPTDGRSARNALTSIYFLLAREQKSVWHRVASDEAWHWYEGGPLELLTASPEADRLTRTVLGPLRDGAVPVHVVPAGWWQAARSLADYTLVGCTVGPGFDFTDFRMPTRGSADAARLAALGPVAAAFLPASP